MKWESKRFLIEIVFSKNWKDGIPKNPNVEKWLVQVTDKFTADEYCPNDNEFKLLTNSMNDRELKMLSEALKIKEKHNRLNLKNPEKREIENHIHKLAKEVVS